MPLRTIEKYFLESADNADVLSGDPQLGNLGKGRYDVIIMAAAAADATFTLSDEKTEVLSLCPIPVRAAAVTYPEIKFNEDRAFTIGYNGPTHPTIAVVDGTNAEMVVWVRYRKVG